MLHARCHVENRFLNYPALKGNYLKKTTIKAGFMYSLNHGFVHQALWDRAGDSENFRWEPGMRWPQPIDEAEPQGFEC
jgi:hypothetical protein